ncbi:MAG: hypothetical protein JRJ47_09885 [Deltaproteobacteria bacterium]|nr:hypothetical protein [Deltaproteobacteria bacterium]
MFKRFAQVVLLVVIAGLFITSCATKPTPIPTAYYHRDYEMTVTVTSCSEEPKMMDSDAGGIIGLFVRSARAGDMEEDMRGISGDTLSELLRQRISEKLEDYFEVVEDDPQLATEVSINQWGYFCPSTLMGIRTGSYQLRIMGVVEVYDTTQKKRERVSYVTAISEKPLGDDPEEEDAQGALLLAVDDYANKVVAVILGEARK